MINIDELKEALSKKGYEVTKEELEEIMDNVDYAGNGKINYTEFLVATIEVKDVLSEDKLFALFKYFDTDNSGSITPLNLKEAFAKTGKALSDSEIHSILAKHDILENGVITYEEFKFIFFTDDRNLFENLKSMRNLRLRASSLSAPGTPKSGSSTPNKVSISPKKILN